MSVISFVLGGDSLIHVNFLRASLDGYDTNEQCRQIPAGFDLSTVLVFELTTDHPPSGIKPRLWKEMFVILARRI